ncbi:hypothetical protein HLB25_13300 [Dickeya dadantii]|uniref:hypothetical protein n=1 Tax=Dickeya dadantii TaxID=204038 RepID=UPI00149605E0|nr:hypothetical protein [Dickeya dadantii]NPE55879.1 hypothetical protein [Dickeya dadantii]NPE67651.1 hypothetical protein [Dickeya dadantii]
MKSQTISAAMAAAIMEDVDKVIDRLERQNNTSKEVLESLTKISSSAEMLSKNISASSSQLVNRMDQLINDDIEIKKEIRGLLKEHRSREIKFYVSVFSLLLISVIALILSVALHKA